MFIFALLSCSVLCYGALWICSLEAVFLCITDAAYMNVTSVVPEIVSETFLILTKLGIVAYDGT